MTQKKDIYRCEVCGNVVEVLHAGGGTLVCCDKTMVLQKPNFEDAAEEKSTPAKATVDKHVPVIEKSEKGLVIKVGETLHPMEAGHYIMWIEAVLSDRRIVRVDFNPGDEPVLDVCDCDLDKCSCSIKEARAYCNVHGLWVSHE